MTIGKPKHKSKAFQVLEIDEILPLLASSYEAGRLVPFIGAGMSRPNLVGWEDFVNNLAKVAHVAEKSNGHPELTAERATATIRNSHSEKEFFDIIGKALRNEAEKPETPKQTNALAAIYWPLTISTNYDHLFYCACRTFEDRLSPLVLGRAPEDCKQVMSALVSPFDREIIWHIQGFLGEFVSQCCPSPVQDQARLQRLQREMVIGHSEYRRAVNTAVHFRRCFGEVFRSRSFLFLGSSLSEEYFWNLFGETLELCGPSPVPHFAFLKKGSKIDARFLAGEMNITVCEYKKHDDLVHWLEDLHTAVEKPTARVSRWSVQLDGGSALEIVPHSSLSVPAPDSDCAVALIVKACTEGKFELDAHLMDCRGDLRSSFAGKSFPEGRHVLSPAPGLFAVRARTKPDSETESDSVGAAVSELLQALSQHKSVLHLHMPSAGGTVPPVYGFIEAVRAFGNWARQNKQQDKRPLHLIAHVGQQVILNLASHQISLHELLTSKLLRFWTVVNSEHGAEPVRRVLYRPPGDPLMEVLTEVLGKIEVQALSEWTISLSPSPRRTPSPLTCKDLGETLCDVGVVFGSVITFSRTRPQPQPNVEQSMIHVA